MQRRINLLILNDYGIIGGGSENRIKLLVEKLIAENLVGKVIIIQKFGQEFNKGNLIVLNSKSILHSFYLVQKIIKKEKIGVVQAHNLHALTPVPLLAAKLLNKPIIFFAHDYWPICGYRSFIHPYKAETEEMCRQPFGKNCRKCLSLKGRLKLQLWRKILGLADAGVASGNVVKNIYEQNDVLKGRWKIITPWINLEEFSKNQNKKDIRKKGIQKKYISKKNILFVGSLIEFKGAWVLAKALKYIKKVFPEINAVFIGDSQEKDSRDRVKIEKIGKKDGTFENMQFLGKRDLNFILQEHSKAAVYACPTVCMETFGLNWAEAMASGVPIVASRIGSVAEYLENKAILTEPRNPEDLANGIIKVLKDNALSRRLSMKGKVYVFKNCSIDVAVRTVTCLYDKILSLKNNKLYKKRTET